MDYEKDEITVGVGGKHIIFNALMATINEGDEVIIPAPYWVSYPDITLLADGKPKIVQCLEENNFKITVKKLEEMVSDLDNLISSGVYFIGGCCGTTPRHIEHFCRALDAN